MLRESLPPPASRIATVVEDLHGTRVEDPYRWLENGNTPETREWVDAQNAHTRAVLENLSFRGKIRERLDELLAAGWVGTPVLRGQRAFYSRRRGRLNQPQLMMRDADGSERTILDPNALSATGLVALDWWYPSDDGRLLAYGVSEGGDELSTLRVLDIESDALLPSQDIPHTRAASVAWLPGGDGFYYSRYPVPGSVPAGEEVYHRHIFLHRLGRPWQSDVEVFGTGRAREDWPSVDISADGRWLLVDVAQGWARNELYLLDREDAAAEFVPLHAGHESLASAQFAGDQLYVQSNRDAPNYALYVVDPEQPARENWKPVLAERPDEVLDSFEAAAGVLVAHEMHNASSRLRVYEADGRLRHEVELPSLGSVTSISGEWTGAEVAFGFTSFAQAPTAFLLNPVTGRSRLFADGEKAHGVETADYVVRQEWATSRDGTRVSVFVVHRRDLEPRSAPTLLTGYGGFNVSRTPAFNPSLPLWLDAGGVYALANLRGGGEYGEAWHQGGMLANKQNVFDDFVGAGEFLVASGIADGERLAISGGSNGGLLVGAALTQRPDLFRAIVCQVPLLDMIRYHHLRIARLWIAEYGSADDAEQFEWLYAYSPYHRVRDGQRYPATFLLTAEGDSRVDPMHARKMAARLQAATASEAPILLRVEQAAGHGQGKPRHKQLDEATDTWSFLFWQLELTPR
ncbi:MAG: prolyl oligopeptidase family serine peptidase [Chloroflexota bacterium]